MQPKERLAAMQFTSDEINQAIAWAMKVPAGADYLDEEDQEDAEAFWSWAEPQLNDSQQKVYDMTRGIYGKTIALVAALKIMDEWTAQL